MARSFLVRAFAVILAATFVFITVIVLSLYWVLLNEKFKDILSTFPVVVISTEGGKALPKGGNYFPNYFGVTKKPGGVCRALCLLNLS